MTVEFVIPGKCIGKERPRFSRFKGFIKTYTPKKTKDYEKLVKKSYIEQGNTNGRLLDGAVKAEICFLFEPPKNVSKKVRQKMIDGEIPYTSKIDIDNGVKSVLDSLNEVAYKDDATVDELHASKKYAEEACTQVRLTDNKHVIKPIFYINKEEKN